MRHQLTCKQAIAGAAIAAAFAIAGTGLASAQDAETTESTSTSAFTMEALAASKEEPATSSDVELCEAVQRGKERFRKWVEEGIPEEFGSEEPFTFNPDDC